MYLPLKIKIISFILIALQHIIVLGLILSVVFFDEKSENIDTKDFLKGQTDGSAISQTDAENSFIAFSFVMDNSIKDRDWQQEHLMIKQNNKRNDTDKLDNNETKIINEDSKNKSLINDQNFIKSYDQASKENEKVILSENSVKIQENAKIKITDKSKVEVKNEKKDTPRDVIGNNSSNLEKLNSKDNSKVMPNDSDLFDLSAIQYKVSGIRDNKNGDAQSKIGINTRYTGDFIRTLNNGMLKYRPTLKYPLQARRFGTQGTVVMILLVNVLGKVESVNIEKSSGSNLLDKSAQNYGKNFIFYPYDIDGKASSFKVRVPVKYQLR